MLHRTLYRKVLRGVMKCKAHPQHLDDMRFVVDPTAFRSTCIAPQATVQQQPKRLKRPSSEHVAVPRATLPPAAAAAAYKAALAAVRQQFRRKDSPDVAKAFWAAKRLDDIRLGKCPSGNGVFYDDETVTSTLYQTPFPFGASFIGEGEAPLARGAEDPGAVVFARSRCANTENGPVRFHVRLSIFNNDSALPLHLLNTHLFIATKGESPTLTEMTSVMPIVNEPIKPTRPLHEGEGKSASASTSKNFDDRASPDAPSSVASVLSDPATAEHGVSSNTLSSMEFDVVIPVDQPAVLRGILYYCHLPAATTTRVPAAPAGKILQSSPRQTHEALVATRHPSALDYTSLRALPFGPLKLDPEATNYVRMSECV